MFDIHRSILVKLIGDNRYVAIEWEGELKLWNRFIMRVHERRTLVVLTTWHSIPFTQGISVSIWIPLLLLDVKLQYAK